MDRRKPPQKINNKLNFTKTLKSISKEEWLVGGAVALLVYFLFSKKGEGLKKNFKICIDPKVEDKELADKYNFDLIPGGKCNYRSKQISLADYPNIIKKYGIKNIIRMNAKESSGVEPNEEKEMCEKEGCTYTFINAHEGYQKGKGYVGTLKKALPILQKGNTLVHCTHGADRTGYVVASHLKDIGAMTDKDELWQYTNKYNSWDSKIKKGKFFGSGFDKYADAFYPIEELEKSKWAKK